MGTVSDIIGSFEPIGLQEMDSVKLMDRTDTKFTFNADRLPLILSELMPHYRILNIAGARVCAYKTLYYDTEELSLYLAHHNERANRYKIRHRTYVESQLGFMEIKQKNNKGRTIKTRIRQNEAGEALSDEAKRFIREQSGIDPFLLRPSVCVNYKRITLVGATERVTIDIELEFLLNGQIYRMQNLAIAEIKQSKQSASPVFDILKSQKLRESSISKYCMGIIATHPQVKQNNFRQKMRIIKTIINDRDTE